MAGEEGRERTAQSFLVEKQEIVEKGYDLSINKYKQTLYKPVEYSHPLEIIADIKQLQKEIATGLMKLEAMLRE